MSALVRATDRGLYCEAGGFYIDPWQAVSRAVITHGHTDHARWGHKRYLSTPTGAVVLHARFGKYVEGIVDELAYGQRERIGDAVVSFHPAGHVLGSGQVRIEHAKTGEVWVVSGDYKTQDDGVSEPFMPVRCHTFITESTFGLPVYHWRPQAEVMAQLNAWWKCNADEGRTCMVACYALGKAQRIMGGLDPSIGPILMHGALCKCTEAYRRAGVTLPQVEHATQERVREAKGRAIVLAPPSAVRSAWAFNLVKKNEVKDLSTAMASGWMQIRGTRRRRSLDTGFALSDHADWDGIMSSIRETGAEAVGVTHGSIGPVVRYLNERGIKAFAVPTHWEGEAGAEEGGGGEEGETGSGGARETEEEAACAEGEAGFSGGKMPPPDGARDAGGGETPPPHDAQDGRTAETPPPHGEGGGGGA
ncbi:MAG: ligase-associated DNA damage response exonuclease [Phycisphaerales bacterium]|nr:ligase-associated DNA damage response exonuclease [Phycisphaerales bacterium]